MSPELDPHYRFQVEARPGYSLAETVAPVAWGGGRWPNQDWIGGQLIAIAADDRGPIIRVVEQPNINCSALAISSNRQDLDHEAWAKSVLGVHRIVPAITDAVIGTLATRFPGMRPFSNGNLFDGIVTAILGQSISVQAAAVTERKLAALFAEPISYAGRLFWPAPTAEQLASADPALVRQSGVTQRRADAIVAIARLAVAGQLIDPEVDVADEPAVYEAVLKLPLVGRWTAESVLLWGLGVDDAYPIGDVALLRAARAAYERPDMNHAEMNALAEAWRPGRSWAARWLWLNLFGPAPLAGSGS